jgi:nicotinate-nucleotide adenylyltransferase
MGFDEILRIFVKHHDIIYSVMHMIIVFGGAFNPPTNAHFEIIETLQSKFSQAHIICLPVGNYYPKGELLPFVHRFNMLKRMCEDMQHVMVSDFENQKMYQGTLKSLEHFKKLYDEDIYFVIGSDHLSSLNQWINYQELLEKFSCIVINRDGYLSLEDAEKNYAHVQHKFIYLEFQKAIASSQIRADIEAHKSYLHPKVYQYIKENQLYQKEPKYV